LLVVNVRAGTGLFMQNKPFVLYKLTNSQYPSNMHANEQLVKSKNWTVN